MQKKRIARDPGRQIREEETIALGRVDTHETEMEWALVSANRDVSIDGPAVEDTDLRLEEGIEVRAGEALLGHLPAGKGVHLGLPVVLQADHQAHIMGVASPEAFKTGIATIGQETATSPGLVNGERPAVMLPSGAEMVAHRRPAADRDHLMDLARCIVPSPGKLLAQGVTHPDRRGIDNVPILHTTERSGQIDLLRMGVGEPPLGQGLHPCSSGASNHREQADRATGGTSNSR